MSNPTQQPEQRLIEVGVPCCLTPGLVHLEQAGGNLATCALGLTLQHPPAKLVAYRRSRGPRQEITGARADVGWRAAKQFAAAHGLHDPVSVEIELATPAFMGLASESMLSLGTARALAGVLGLPPEDTPGLVRALNLPTQHALPAWGFDQGGLLLVQTQFDQLYEPGDSPPLPPLVWRAEIAHAEQEAWVFVLYLPRVESGTVPETLESDLLAQMLAAAHYLSAETGQVVQQVLQPALANDDIARFGQAWGRIQQLNEAALAAAGYPLRLSTAEQEILELMQQHGALVCGRSLTGQALYGLVQGARQSIDLRTVLRQHVGTMGGRVLATIADNDGARHVYQPMGPQYTRTIAD